MTREPITAADYAGIEAASEWAEHGDEDDRPTLAECEDDERGQPGSFRPDFGPNDHTCQVPKLRGLTCHVCQREGPS